MYIYMFYILYIYIHLILTTTLWCCNYHYPHLTDKESEIKRLSNLSKSLYSSCLLIFYILRCFDILKILLTRERLDFLESQFFQTTNGSTSSMPFICKPPFPSLFSQPPFYLTLTHQGNISPALNHPRARYQATRDHPESLKSIRIIQISSS